MKRVTALLEFGDGYVRNLDTERSVEIGEDGRVICTIQPGDTRYLFSEGLTARVLRKRRKKRAKG